MTERTQNADFRRKAQIFADPTFLLEIPALGGRRKPQKTADSRRKPKIFAENRRKPQIGLRHLRSVTFSSALFFLSGWGRGRWSPRRQEGAGVVFLIENPSGRGWFSAESVQVAGRVSAATFWGGGWAKFVNWARS